ncbi:MAG: protoporphyrinogen oxidase [Chloroflexi bacterium]|nr:protoporphyrinogen oxidase [Chloroflexota bacterium]
MKVVVVGGGAAGLAAAYALRRAADEGHDVDWLLLEKDGRLGGKIWTERIGEFIVDGGPDCYLTEKPWIAQMAARLGIEDHLLPSDDDRKKTFIYSGGRMHELPDGVWMMVPTKFMPFVKTSLFSWPGKMRMGMDLFVPRRVDGDETLADFVRRRLGRECLEKLAEPMVGGVHAADPYQMSLQATFPRFLEMERKHGSLIKAFLAARKRMASTASGNSGRTYFTTLRYGMQEITDGMADVAGRERLLTGKRVVRIEERGATPRYAVHVAGDLTYPADAVVVSTEAYTAAEFLRPLDGRLAKLLDTIPWTSAATVSLAYRGDTIGHDLHGFGFLVPSVEKRKIMASTWSSTKWPGRAPEGHALLRVFVGGPHNQSLVELDDAAMVRVVRDELREMMGITAEPEFARVFRWVKGMPQYTLGHLERLEAMEERLAEHPGLYLCGASYRGIGTGDCMNSGEVAVGKIVGA